MRIELLNALLGEKRLPTRVEAVEIGARFSSPVRGIARASV